MEEYELFNDSEDLDIDWMIDKIESELVWWEEDGE